MIVSSNQPAPILPPGGVVFNLKRNSGSQNLISGGSGRTRTDTLYGHEILSLACIPISSPSHAIYKDKGLPLAPQNDKTN